MATPLSVHTVNGRRGRFAPALVASLGIAAVELLGLSTFGGSEAALLFLLGSPVAYVVSAVQIERATAGAPR